MRGVNHHRVAHPGRDGPGHSSARGRGSTDLTDLTECSSGLHQDPAPNVAP